GVPLPVVSAAARPLFVERERTYQLEQTLSWLAGSRYCTYPIAFAERAGDPVESLESVITRRHRPPADISDVARFWNGVLRCKGDENQRNTNDVITITFGGPALSDATEVFEMSGAFAGPATAWVRRQ